MGGVKSEERIRLRIPLLWREWVLLGLLLTSGIALTFLSDFFLTASNLLRATRYAAEIGMVALPMTMIIITRGVDLSVASTMALSAMSMGLLWQSGINIWLAALMGVATGTLGGLANGWVIARVRVPPIIVTLATLAIYRGIATGMSGGRGIIGFPEGFIFLGQGGVGLVPLSTLVWLFLTIIMGIFLSRTSIGRIVYAIGYNELAVRFSGIRVDRMLLGLYTLSGFVSGLSGVFYAARVATAKSNAAMGYELAVITAVVLGGTSLSGGEGTILGTVLGVLIITILQNGLTLARVPSAVQDVLIGVVLLLAVLSYRERRVRRKEVRMEVARRMLGLEHHSKEEGGA